MADEHNRGDRTRDRLREEDEMDRAALAGPKSQWVGPNDPAAGDPVSDDERRGLNVVAQNDPRGDGAINGVSDASGADVHATAPVTAPRDGGRRNPPPDELLDGSTLT